MLLAMLAGALQAPLVKTAGLLQALPRNFAYGLKALIDQILSHAYAGRLKLRLIPVHGAIPNRVSRLPIFREEPHLDLSKEPAVPHCRTQDW